MRFERNGIVNREKIDITEEDKRLMDNKLMMFYTGSDAVLMVFWQNKVRKLVKTGCFELYA